MMGHVVLDLKWALNFGEVAIEADAEALNSLNGNKGIGTLHLLRMAAPDVQIIDGSVHGYDSAGFLQVKITAVDSSSWDVGGRRRYGASPRKV
jgi:hypothetical protein